MITVIDVPRTKVIPGPIGDFEIPSDPAANCEKLATDLWAGEYDHPQLPRTGIRTLLDCGANVGAFSAWALARWGRDVIVAAYEPNVDVAAYAERNLPGTAIVHRLAVTVDPDPTLHVHVDPGMSSTRYSDFNRNEPRKVPAVHPRDLPAADCWKIDVEGSEPEAVEHYQHFATLRIFMCEFHSREDLARIMWVVEGAGMWPIRIDMKVQGIAIWIRETP